MARAPRESLMLTPGFSLGHNHRRILETLRLNGPLSRIDIAELTELQPATLTRLSQDLIEWGILEDVGFEDVAAPRSTAKRKTRLLRLDGGTLRTVGIAFTLDRIGVSLSSLAGDVVAETALATEIRAPEAAAAEVAACVADLLNACDVRRDQLLAAGIALPINFSDNAKRVFTPSEWPLWRGSEPRALFEAALGVPTWVENDGHAAALAEAYFGAGAQMESFCLVYFGYGLGGGTILNRRLFRGTFGNAAAFGGWFPHGAPRPSGRDLMLFLEGQGIRHASLFDLDDDLGHDPRLAPWLDRVVAQLDPLIGHAQVLFDGDAIILGGLLPRSVLDALAGRLRARAADRPSDTAILVSAIGRDRFHLGAACVPQYEVTAPHKFRGRAVKGY